MEQKVKTSYSWICVPADVLSAAITSCVLGTKNCPTMQIPVFTEDAEVFSNGALVNALLAGLDDWYRLSEIDRPEDNMYAIKFLMTHDSADSTQVITTRDLVAIEGEAYRLKLDLEDKWLAACRASVLYNKETPASRLLTREQMESCMATYLELLQNEKLNEVMSQQEHIPTSDLFTPKYVWKPFSKKVLTNTICEEPGVQADIAEYADYISEYLQRLATSINVFGCKEVGNVKARVTLFGTSIVVPVYLDRVLRYSSLELVAKWLLDDEEASCELLYTLAESNHKIALLICIWNSIKTIIENDTFSYEYCRPRIEVPMPMVLSWYAKYDPDAYSTLVEYLKFDKAD